jgi:glucose 1-dehydrogenase
MIDLAGKVALVTGAGRGIGKGCALELARHGAELIINDRPGGLDLEAAANEIRALGAKCHTLESDVFSRDGCEQLVQQALGVQNRIDILISNPAYSLRGAFLDYSPEDFERTIGGTLISGFHMGQLVARHMATGARGGKILFISSVLGEMPIGLCSAYSAAKAGLNQLTQAIAVELSPHRINVNAIEPGWIDTPGEHDTFSDEAIAEEGRRLPWGRMGTPDDIGKAATFLVSDAADYITGAVLPVDGLFRFKDCLVEKTVPIKDA